MASDAMCRRRRHFGAALLLAAFALGAKGGILDRYMAVEIGRLEETQRLLARFAAQVWPGWDNYAQVEFRFRFPNQTELAVNPPAPPPGFLPVRKHAGSCGPVYVDRRRQEPGALTGTLVGGGGGSRQVRIRLREKPGIPPGAGDEQILLYVHEIFHGYQSKVMTVASDEALLDYLVGAEYAALCEVEGCALERALQEADDARVRECLLDYHLARQYKKSFIPAAVAAAEENIAVSEGTATYAALRTAQLILAERYRPRLSRRLDSSFAGFRGLRRYLEQEMVERPRLERAQTFDTMTRYYTFGAQLCFLLDRFRPGWKKDFFASGRSLDALVADCVGGGEASSGDIVARLEKRYGWQQVLARHAAAVAARDAAVESLARRRGRTYVIDLTAIREFARPRSRGRQYELPGAGIVYPDGIQALSAGAIELAGSATPWRNTGLFTLEWTADAAAGEDVDPEIAWAAKEGEALRWLVYRTAGFTLKAPLARLRTQGTTTRIEVLARRAP
jgi:hypothetical protein